MNCVFTRRRTSSTICKRSIPSSAEPRGGELENLRYAARVDEARNKMALLDDPHMDKQMHATLPGTLPAAPRALRRDPVRR
jgi:hypothetical protein